MTDVISREDARKQGLIHFYTGVPCIHGHTEKRFVGTKCCLTCAKQSGQRCRRNNKDILASERLIWAAANSDRMKAIYRRHYVKNKGNRIELSLRRAARIHAITQRADRQEINRIYRECPVGKQVDHIIPLKHGLVCGLHTPANLQYLSGKDNRSKSNKWVPEWL